MPNSNVHSSILHMLVFFFFTFSNDRRVIILTITRNNKNIHLNYLYKHTYIILFI